MFCRLGHLRLTTISAGLFVIALAGCSRAPEQRGPERVAVLVFANLTSDPSLDWVGRALSNGVAAQSAGNATWRAFESLTVRDAQIARATQVVQGYFAGDRRKVRVHATIYDERTRRNVGTLEATGAPDQVIAMTAALVRQFAPSVTEYTTKNVEAVRALFSGDAKAAIAADPQFGVAHLELVQQLTRGEDQSALRDALAAASKARLTEPERARLNLLAAQSAGDAGARVDALKQVARTSPADPQIWRAIADLDVQRKKYADAAASYARVLDLSPDDQAALNSRGYALLFSGDFDGAVKSLEEYRLVAPDSANALDSLAEAHFWAGKYADAARLFAEAHAKDPRTLGGLEPFRSSLALFLSGDASRADQAFEQFVAAREKAGDPSAPAMRQVWLRLTGRKAAATGASSAEQAVAALWALYDGDRSRARVLAESARRSASSPPLVNLALTMLFLTEPSAPADVWVTRGAKALPRPEQTALRGQLLGLALLLDGKFAEAARVWREIFDATPGFNSYDARIALEWALRASGDNAGAQKIAPAGLFPPRGPEVGPLAVLHAKAIELHGKPRQ